ncbi:MAG: hypothetical protein K0R67_553 [Paenibacillus sp.]|nr:hypothetical protein [Paenibacillus sp.]
MRLLNYSAHEELTSLQVNSNFESITITQFLLNLETLEVARPHVDAHCSPAGPGSLVLLRIAMARQ